MLGRIRLVLAVVVLIGHSSTQARCLQAQPHTVKLRGILERITFAGPPNYESIAQGDRAEVYFVLKLKTPICIENAKGEQITAAQLQLFLQPEQYSIFRARLGKTVGLSGQLWPAETGHHHTPLMFTPTT